VLLPALSRSLRLAVTAAVDARHDKSNVLEETGPVADSPLLEAGYRNLTLQHANVLGSRSGRSGLAAFSL